MVEVGWVLVVVRVGGILGLLVLCVVPIPPCGVVVLVLHPRVLVLGERVVARVVVGYLEGEGTLLSGHGGGFGSDGGKERRAGSGEERQPRWGGDVLLRRPA